MRIRMGVRSTVAFTLTAGALALAGCGADEIDAGRTTAPPPAADPSGAMLADAGLSVAEALAEPGGPIVAVRAYLFVAADGSARLCDAVLESFPPQCGRPSMPATGLPDELIAGLPEDTGRRWSEGPVQLLGRVADGVFVNDREALAAG
jgi:hypothetical protein